MSDLQEKIAARGILTLSREAAKSALDSGNPDAARLLLWLALHPEENELSPAAQALGLTQAQLEAALAPLGAAAPKDPEAPAPKSGVQTLPEYTGEELAQALFDEHFAFLCQQAERAFRRPLRRHECSTLLALYEDVGMPAEVLALVLTYCTSRAGRTSPDGTPARVSFAQVRTEAMRWHEAGIDGAEKAEAHIRMLEEKHKLTARVERIVGISDRRPSPTELRYIEKLIALDPTLDLIAKAYDITATHKGALIWPYLTRIVERWHERGWRTPEQVDAGENAGKTVRRTAPEGASDRQYEDEVLRFLHGGEENE